MEAKRVLPLLLTFAIIISSVMANVRHEEEQTKVADNGSVQIVYMERASGDDDPEYTHIQTLASVLGSEEKARKAILYSYKHTVNGFSAKLTPEQVDSLSKQPGVLQIVPSGTYQLHTRAGVSLT